MRNWRFWLAQFIWLIAVVGAGVSAAEGAGEATPFILLFSFVLTGFVMKWGAKSKNEIESSATRYDGHVIARVVATGLIWITYLGGTVTAVIEMAGWGVLLALILMIPAIVFTGLLWAWERISGVTTQQMQSAAENSEKRKRRNIDTVLRDLSDDELLRLRDRLTEGHSDDDLLYDNVVSDDGELVYRN